MARVLNMIVYISGPMRSKPNFNYSTFQEVEKALYCGDPPMFAGIEDYTVINPAGNFDGDKTLPVFRYMQRDLEQVLSADVIVLLPDWDKSEGAKIEVAVAKATGKRFYQAVPYDDHGSQVWTFIELDEPATVSSPRASILDEAKSLVTGDRNSAYGPPSADFQRSADAANAYGYRGPDGRSLAAHDIAILVSLVKISRLMWTPEKRDSWVDVAGYAACGYECVVETAKDAA
jgi:hypothetical protein